MNSLAGESRKLLKVAVTRRLLHGTARAVICEKNIKECAEKDKKGGQANFFLSRQIANPQICLGMPVRKSQICEF